jgi:hypothetical protein
MGGFGSGNRNERSPKKYVVEDCLSLDATRWMREGILDVGIQHCASWCWYLDSSKTQKLATIDYEVDCASPDSQVWLSYTIAASGERIDYPISLENTEPKYGGLRWWFLCPLSLNGLRCKRRVTKLYLPPGGRYFGCRRCYDLTYRSCQEAHKIERMRRFLTHGMAEAIARLKRKMGRP